MTLILYDMTLTAFGGALINAASVVRYSTYEERDYIITTVTYVPAAHTVHNFAKLMTFSTSRRIWLGAASCCMNVIRRKLIFHCLPQCQAPLRMCRLRARLCGSSGA